MVTRGRECLPGVHRPGSSVYLGPLLTLSMLDQKQYVSNICSLCVDSKAQLIHGLDLHRIPMFRFVCGVRA